MDLDVGHLFVALSNLGAWGVLISYIIWDKQADRKERREQSVTQQANYERDIASREKLSASLTALCMVIQGRPSV